MNPTDQFTRNKFVDYCLSLIPDDPYDQALYMYILTGMVFFGLIGYGLTSWYYFFTTMSIKNFFSAIFMTAIGLISSFGLKQTRNQFLVMKEMKNIKPGPVQSKQDMLKEMDK